jgi:putative DNA primase/helicase
LLAKVQHIFLSHCALRKKQRVSRESSMTLRPVRADDLLVDDRRDNDPRAKIDDVGVGCAGESSPGTALVPYMPGPEAETTRPAYISFDDFIMDSSGLWAVVDSHGIWICSAFEILARTRKPSGHGWSSALRWKDDDRRLHRSVVSDADLQRNFVRVCGELASRGLRIAVGPSRELLLQYLNRVSVPNRITIVSHTGWHALNDGKVFVLPNEAIGRTGTEPVILDGAAETSNGYDSRGTLDEWRDTVATQVAGHTVPVLAMSTAFAGPLLGIVDGEGGGLHFFGNSSIGKTTMCMKGPASVWGAPNFVRSWRSTANGLEALAAVATDTLLPLDELGVADAHDVAAGVYQLAGSAGKNRAKSNGALSGALSWRVMVLSTGELPIAAKLAEAAGKVRAGQLVRLLDLPADAGRGFGVFDAAGPDKNPAKLADAVKRATFAAYGTAGPAFVRQLVARGYERVRRLVLEHIEDFRAQNVPKGADGQVERAADRFALIAAAGELAISWGILPWHPGEADQAASRGFQNWIRLRGGLDAQEDHQALAQVRRFFGQHGESRFQRLDGDNAQRSIDQQAGWVKGAGDQRTWWILPRVWKEETCAGLDATATARLLAARGVLKPDKRAKKFARAERTPGGTKRVYVIRGTILTDTPGDGAICDAN